MVGLGYPFTSEILLSQELKAEAQGLWHSEHHGQSAGGFLGSILLGKGKPPLSLPVIWVEMSSWAWLFFLLTPRKLYRFCSVYLKHRDQPVKESSMFFSKAGSLEMMQDCPKTGHSHSFSSPHINSRWIARL